MSEPNPSRGGAAGMLLLFSVAIAVAGLGFDFGVNTARAFWIGASAGAPALIALGAVIVSIGAAHAMRWALGRPEKGGERGGVDQP